MIKVLVILKMRYNDYNNFTYSSGQGHSFLLNISMFIAAKKILLLFVVEKSGHTLLIKMIDQSME